jgi:hypothetical protein
VFNGESMMNENSETSLHSAKAVADFYQKKANDAKKNEAATKKINQIASEQVASQKEFNELATKALTEANLRSEQERALHELNSTDVVDIKPNFFGLGANLNEAWRRFKKWRSK